MSESEAPRGTICKCGSAKTYHRDIDKRDHEYETRYPARHARSDLPAAPPPLDGLEGFQVATLCDVIHRLHPTGARALIEEAGTKALDAYTYAILRDKGETT